MFARVICLALAALSSVSALPQGPATNAGNVGLQAPSVADLAASQLATRDELGHYYTAHLSCYTFGQKLIFSATFGVRKHLPSNSVQILNYRLPLHVTPGRSGHGTQNPDALHQCWQFAYGPSHATACFLSHRGSKIIDAWLLDSTDLPDAAGANQPVTSYRLTFNGVKVGVKSIEQG